MRCDIALVLVPKDERTGKLSLHQGDTNGQTHRDMTIARRLGNAPVVDPEGQNIGEKTQPGTDFTADGRRTCRKQRQCDFGHQWQRDLADQKAVPRRWLELGTE